jgi:hypothetical protein
VAAEEPFKVVGVVTRSDLLKARARHVEQESKRERFFRLPGTPRTRQVPTLPRR